MGLQNQLSDVSSESIIIITVVLIAKSARYLRSVFSTIVHALGLSSPRFDPDRHGLSKSLYDVVGSGLAGVIILCEQMNLNRCDARRSDGSDCVVCLDRIGGGDHVRELACRHVFHGDCLDGWAVGQLNLSCPLCRAPMAAEARVEHARRRVAGDLLAWFHFQ